MTFYRDGNGDYVNDAVCCMSVSHFFCLLIRLKARVSASGMRVFCKFMIV